MEHWRVVIVHTIGFSFKLIPLPFPSVPLSSSPFLLSKSAVLMCLIYSYDMLYASEYTQLPLKVIIQLCSWFWWTELMLGWAFYGELPFFYFLLFSLFLSTFVTLITCLHEQGSWDQPCICPFWLYVEHLSGVCSRTWDSQTIHSAYYRHLFSRLLPHYSLEWVHWGVFCQQSSRVLVPPGSHHHVLD